MNRIKSAALACLAASLLLVTLLAAPASAQIQGGVQQRGQATTSNCASWYANGAIQDAGAPCGTGTGTVTSVSVVTANGVSATVANPTTTPALTFTLGAITPSSVAIGAGSAITSSGPGGALTAAAFAAYTGPYCPLTGCTYSGTVTGPDAGTWSGTGLSTLTLSVNGASLGGNAVSVLGTIATTNLSASAAVVLNQTTVLLAGGANNLHLGPADAAAPAAQTLSVQSVVAGTTNTAGANWTFDGSKGTGTGLGGSLIFQVAPAGTTGTSQNALATALTIAPSNVGINKHLAGLGSAPTAVAAGGTGSASLSTGANDVHGTVTGGTLSTSITITFVNAYANPPDCTVSSDGTIVPTSVTTTSGAAGAATLVIGMSAATGAKYTYHCMGQ